MKKEQLIELGIEDEATQKEIFKLHGLGIESLKTENATLATANENLTADLSEAQGLIEGFGQKEMDFAELTKSSEEYKAKFEEADASRKAEVKQLKFHHALNNSLKEAGSKNSKATKALLKMDELHLGEDGEIDGLASQLEELMVENDFLFEVSDPVDDDDDGEGEGDSEEDPEGTPRRIVSGGQSRKILGDTVTKAARDAAGLND